MLASMELASIVHASRAKLRCTNGRSIDEKERERKRERTREREREREREGEKERKKFVLLFHASLQTLCTRAILSRSDSERIVFLFVQECYIKKFCLEKEK